MKAFELEEQFFKSNSKLLALKKEIMITNQTLIDSFSQQGQLLVCGNGGSCADADHIVGEMMKGFLLQRPLSFEEKEDFMNVFGLEGQGIADQLQQGLPTISLNVHSALISAFSNDVSPELTYAQQVWGYGRKGDVLIGISTSGNAKNVVAALKTAKVKGLKTIGLTGRDGGKLADICDTCIIAPANDTYLIQEYHIQIYHFICSYVEAYFFDNDSIISNKEV